MALDGLLMSKLAQELDSILRNTRLDKVQQPSRFDLLLTFSIRGKNKLLLSANPNHPTAHLSSASFINPQIAPRFAMYLRKHLQGARVEKIYTPDYERILVFEFKHLDELRDEHNVKLVVELMSRHSNIMLIDENNIIKDALIYVDAETSRHRLVLPQQRYKLPPAQDKPLPEERINELEGYEAGMALAKIDTDKPLKRSLLNLSLGLSPQLVNEILYRAQVEGTRNWVNLTEDERSAIVSEASALLSAVTGSNSAYLFPNANEDTSDYHCIELASLGEAIPQATINEAIDLSYNSRESMQKTNQRRNQLSTLVRKELKHQEKLVEVFANDLNASQNFDEDQKHGELILAQLYNLPSTVPGDGKIKIVDYYDEALAEIELTLDPKYDLVNNANRLFKRANKKKDTYAYASKSIEQASSAVEYLERLLSMLDNADDVDDLESINYEIENGPLSKELKRKSKQKPESNSKKKRSNKRSTPALGPRHYITPTGRNIYAGRNNMQNDSLTFRQADADDLWFHAKDRPGTHIILENSDGAATEEDILVAAQLAAWHSLSAKEKAIANIIKLDVDYCPIANVNKPSGAKPGFVTYDNYNTVYVDANAHLDLETPTD